MILRVIEVVGLILIGLFISTQMLIPALNGGILFPMFKKTGKLEAELAEATQEVKDATLEKVVAAKHQEAVAVKNEADKA